MAIAVSPSPVVTTQKIHTPSALLPAGLLGAVFIVGVAALVFTGIPLAWKQIISPALKLGSFADVTFKLALQLIAMIGLFIIGRKIIGTNAPHGVHGAIFIIISTLITIFFLARAVPMVLGQKEGTAVGFFVGSIFLFGFLAMQFLRGKTFTAWSIGLEDAGFFKFKGYKNRQGQLVRRLTMIGMLVLLASGVISLMNNVVLNSNSADWVIQTPFLGNFIVLPDIRLSVPFLAGLAALWFAWRVVNIPAFADFLIATEAEMNKVSWLSRARLLRDTIVVLITLALITLFLFVVDLFWGWFLSLSFVGILPTNEDLKRAMPDAKQPINTDRGW